MNRPPPPPTTSSPEVLRYETTSDPSTYTSIQEGRVCILAVAGGGCLTVMDAQGNVKIRPSEDARSQMWRIETSTDRYGFRSLSTGRVMGVSTAGSIGAGTREIRGWERFSIEVVNDGFRLGVKWGDHQCFLFRPSLSDHLEVSGHRSIFTPIVISYVDN